MLPAGSIPVSSLSFICIFISTLISVQTVSHISLVSPAACFNLVIAVCQLPRSLPFIFFFYLCPSPFLPLLPPSLPPRPIVKLKGSSSACIPSPPRPHSTSTFTTLSGCLRTKKQSGRWPAPLKHRRHFKMKSLREDSCLVTTPYRVRMIEYTT